MGAVARAGRGLGMSTGRSAMNDDVSGAYAEGQRLADVGIEGIMRALPHRHPFLMVDRIVDIVAHESATGIKCVTASEPHFQGHFPEKPIMPGVLIIEAMAQRPPAPLRRGRAARSALQAQYTGPVNFSPGP